MSGRKIAKFPHCVSKVTIFSFFFKKRGKFRKIKKLPKRNLDFAAVPLKTQPFPIQKNSFTAENCVQHIIPKPFFKKDLMQKFPSNLQAKVKLSEKFGYPSIERSNGYFKILPRNKP